MRINIKGGLTLWSCLTAVILYWTSFAIAAPFASYDAGVAPASGNTGAADPATQGWTFNNGGIGANQFAAGYDSGDGGWRTVDGTITGPAFYQQNLNAATAAALNDPWSLSWTFSMDSDAIGSAGTVVNNYYVNRTDDNVGLWIDHGNFSYRLQFEVSTGGTNDLFVDDGTNTFQLTNDGSGFDAFHSGQIIFDGVNAALDFEGNSFALASSGPQGIDRLVFGPISSGGQGSAIWNQVTLAAVPEPASIAIWSLLGLGLAGYGYRRLRQSK